jgi:hypothetical protein
MIGLIALVELGIDGIFFVCNEMETFALSHRHLAFYHFSSESSRVGSKRSFHSMILLECGLF